MNVSLFPRTNRIVNLVINDHSIRYVELKHPNTLTPSKWGERFLPSGVINNGKVIDFQTLKNILEECVDEWKIKNRKVRFLVPESSVIIRKVSIPADVKDDELQGYLYLELGSSIHLPFDDPVFDAVVLSGDKNKKEVLLFASPEDIVLEYSNLLTDVRLNPIAADISPLSLYRLYYHLNMVNDEQQLLLVQFDIHMTNICIFENHTPVFMHHIPTEYSEENWEYKLNHDGIHKITHLGDALGSNLYFEDIYKEINRLSDFYRYSLNQGKKQIRKILVNGDHPMLDKINVEMKRRFEIPVETISINSPRVEFHNLVLPRTHYLALGLALKEV